MELYSLPYNDRANKYFTLWRESLAHIGVSVKEVPENSVLRFLFLKTNTESVLIIHWSTLWYGSSSQIKSIIKIIINGFALLLIKYVRKIPIVWIVHNQSAHEYAHHHIDRLGRALTVFFASAIVAQQQDTARQLTLRYPNKKIQYIPHGNYVDAYGPRVTDRTSARTALRYTDDDVVILSIGVVRPYKQLEKIITSFTAANASHLKLCIIGKAHAEYESSLRSLIALNGSIQFKNMFIPDDQMAMILAAADYTVFFYDESELTSGGVLLSLSYGVPVISRAIAGAEMVHDGVNGYIFANESELRALFITLSNGAHPQPEEVLPSVEELSWDSVAKSYEKLLSYTLGV